jgi:hypothetical protein
MLVPMDQLLVCRVLNQLRRGKTEFSERGRFAALSKLAPYTIQKIEEGDILPELPTIEKWVLTCGGSLAGFFVEIERASVGQRLLNEVVVVHGFEEYYRLLTEIIQSENDMYIDGIYSNLRALAFAAKSEGPSMEGVAPSRRMARRKK